METRFERTLVPGKLLREPPDVVRRVLATELQSGEVVVSLLETASEHPLGSGGATVWVALTDRRALVLATKDGVESYVRAADTTTVAHKARFGRDEIIVGEHTFKCPLLRGGSEFKAFAQLAEAHHLERLRHAARLRLEDGSPDAASALCAAGLDREQDPGLLTLNVIALAKQEKYPELGPALKTLMAGDPGLSHWRELYEQVGKDSRTLWMLYQASHEANNAPKARSLLSDLRATPPADTVFAELISWMDADEGELEGGLARAAAWRDRGVIDTKSFLTICAILQRGGLDTEPLYRQWALALAQLGQTKEALDAIQQALTRAREAESLRILADLLLRSARAAEAVVPLEQLLEAGHDDAWIRSRLGEGYEALGRLDDAVASRELALERLLALPDSEADHVAGERRALARLHRTRASSQHGSERDVSLACSELLERGADWAARLTSAPSSLLAGSALEATVEVLAARRLGHGPTTACLTSLEAVLDPKAETSPPPPPPALMSGGVIGTWPAAREVEDGVVLAGKRSSAVRHAAGEAIVVEMPAGLPRGLHQGRIALVVPNDVRPTYQGERVRGELELEVTPPGVRFPIRVAPRHEPRRDGQPRSEQREGSGKLPLKVRVPDAAWSFGEAGEVEIEVRLDGSRTLTSLEVSLVATERMRPPHKGERMVETYTWAFPVFAYEAEEGVVKRRVRLELPLRGTTTGFWTWFELVWVVQVRALRKDKAEVEVEVPVLLRYPALPAADATLTFDVPEQPLLADPPPQPDDERPTTIPGGDHQV